MIPESRQSAREAVLALLAGARRPLRPAEIMTALRDQGVSRNPGGVILSLVASGDILMGEDRRLRLQPAVIEI